MHYLVVVVIVMREQWLVHLTHDQEVPGLLPDGNLNFRVSESTLSTAPWAGKVIVTSAHPPGGI